MSVVIWTRKKSRLSTLINQPGGTTIGMALQDVEARLDGLREEGIALVDAAIAGLEARAAAAVLSEAWIDEVYDLSSAVIKAVGPFGLRTSARPPSAFASSPTG